MKQMRQKITLGVKASLRGTAFFPAGREGGCAISSVMSCDNGAYCCRERLKKRLNGPVIHNHRLWTFASSFPRISPEGFVSSNPNVARRNEKPRKHALTMFGTEERCVRILLQKRILVKRSRTYKRKDTLSSSRLRLYLLASSPAQKYRDDSRRGWQVARL